MMMSFKTSNGDVYKRGGGGNIASDNFLIRFLTLASLNQDKMSLCVHLSSRMIG